MQSPAEAKRTARQDKIRPHLRNRCGLYFLHPTLKLHCCSGSFNRVDRAAVNTSTTVGTERGIDHMHVTLLADRVNRAGVCTGGAIDTLIVDCVGHETFLLLIICWCRNFSGEFTATDQFCPAQTTKPSNLKKLAILPTFY
jgi:hypothetical protein